MSAGPRPVGSAVRAAAAVRLAAARPRSRRPPPRSRSGAHAQGLPPLEAPTTFAAPTGWRAQLRKATAPIGAGLAALWKLKVFLVIAKLKFLGVALSMGVSVAAYAWIFGWTFAVGFVLLIFVHEIGHVIVLRMRGIKAGLPVFVPFMGAFVSMKESPRTVYDEALSGIAGPAFGSSGAHWSGGRPTHADRRSCWRWPTPASCSTCSTCCPSCRWTAAAPAAALHPATWAVGLLGLLLLFFYRPTPIIPFILLLGGRELYYRWKGRDTAESRRYYAIKPQQRAVIGVAYLGLITLLVFAMNATYVKRGFH